MLKIIKNLLKKILFRPRGLKYFGQNSYIKKPFLLNDRDCISIGFNSFIHKNSEITAIKNDHGKIFNPLIEIGNNVYIGQSCHMHTMSNLFIGNGCALSDNVYISGASHGYTPDAGLIMEQALTYRDVTIGENCFIGRNVFISPGVILGKNCVVGANSVVTKSFPEYSMIGGIPAKILKRYSFDVNEWVKVHD
jgi:lipopolysaccharide O-acetyltransferase